MKWILISKKHILVCTIVFITLLCVFLFYQIYASGDEENYRSSNFSVITNLQNKLGNLYHEDEKVAYLTFDDGPTKIATTKILDVLKEHRIHGNFFVIGYRVKEFPQIVKRAYEEGNFIANHTYSHKNSKLYQNKESFIQEILDTDKAIADAIEITQYQSHLFRFPNGSQSKQYSSAKKNCKQYLKEIGYCYVNWNALNNNSLKKYSSYELVEN